MYPEIQFTAFKAKKCHCSYILASQKKQNPLNCTSYSLRKSCILLDCISQETDFLQKERPSVESPLAASTPRSGSVRPRTFTCSKHKATCKQAKTCKIWPCSTPCLFSTTRDLCRLCTLQSSKQQRNQGPRVSLTPQRTADAGDRQHQEIQGSWV